MAIHGQADGFEGAYVTGWAYDDAARAAPEIDVRDADGVSVATGRANRMRPDLNELGIGRFDVAFRVPIPADHPTGPVHLFANGVELRGSPLRYGAGTVDGHLEAANGRISGWALRRTGADEPPLIELVDEAGDVFATPVPRRDGNEAASFRPWLFEATMPDRYLGRESVSVGLRADGALVDTADVPAELRGFIDHVEPGSCRGWLLYGPDPGRWLALDLWVDDELVATRTCAIRREDLLDGGLTRADCGFEFRFDANPSEVATTKLTLKIAGTDVAVLDTPIVLGRKHAYLELAKRLARASLSSDWSPDERSALGLVLRETIDRVRHGPPTLNARLLGRPPRAEGDARLTVVIPVYKGVEQTRACIESVLATTDRETTRILVVNDASPQAAMAGMLDRFADRDGMRIVDNPVNLGFIGTVNRAFAMIGIGDVLLLNADTVVFPGAIDEMRRAMASDPAIATVTAMSNNATIFSYPSPEAAQDRLDDMGWDEVAAQAALVNRGMILDVPTGHGFCMLISRAALHLVPRFDTRFGRGYGEENAFCLTVADLGYRNVVAAGAFVFHEESVSFGHEDRLRLVQAGMGELDRIFPEYIGTVMAFQREGGLRRARWGLDRLRLRRSGKRFVVSVEHDMAGGSARAARDLLDTLDARDRVLTVEIGAHAIRLRSAEPLVDASFARGEFGELLAVLGDLDLKTVIVHAVIGLEADELARLTAFATARDVTFVAHDFYPACPRVDLIDASGRYCGVAPVDKCDRCVELGGRHARARKLAGSVAGHREAMARFMAAARVIAPSRDAVAHLRRAFPEQAMTAVPHHEFPVERPARREAADPYAVVLLGAIGPHKGSAALLALAERAYLERPDIHFHLVGYSNLDDQLRRFGNVTVYGRYDHASLPDLMATANGSYALFLHAWPETYSYTLSEAMAFGLYPVVPDLGAPAERVREAGVGTVFPFPFNADTVLAALALCIDEDRAARAERPAVASISAEAVRGMFLPERRVSSYADAAKRESVQSRS